MNCKLAINGGDPIRTKPWSENLTIGEEEKKFVMDVLDKGHLSLFVGSHDPGQPFSFWGGPVIKQLEDEWSEYYQVKHAVSVNSATSGLYAAVGALEIGYGDEVIVSPFTMTACAAAPLIYGAIPIFADVEPNTGCLDAESIRQHITERTRAIIVVHQFGIPADMDAIMEIARANDLKVIEDCAQAHGAKYNGKYVGTIGDIGVFSLNVNKTIHAGEGGVCVTNDDELRYRLALIRNHGEAVVGPANYANITNIVGFNYRMIEVQAAIGIEQLKKLNYFNDIRLSMVDYLNARISKYECFIAPKGKSDCLSTYYVYPLRYLHDVGHVRRDRIVASLNAEGMRFFEGYTKPLYMLPVYQNKVAFKAGYPWKAPENSEVVTNYFSGACPNAEKLHYEEMLITDVMRYPHGEEDVEDIARAFEKVMDNRDDLLIGA